MTDKSADKRRRGFVFVTYTTEEAVDRVTQVQFHSIGETKVRLLVCLLYLHFVFLTALLCFGEQRNKLTLYSCRWCYPTIRISSRNYTHVLGFCLLLCIVV